MLLYQNNYMKKQLPSALEVMTSSEYTHLADRVRQAELDSMHTLGFDVPELWAQNRGEYTDMPASLTQTQSTAFAASNMATLEPPTKRQKVQSSDMQSVSRSALLQKQQECEDLECKVLDTRAKTAVLELRIQQARLAEMEARHKSQQVRASCCGGRLQIATDLAAGTTLGCLQPTPVRDQCDMTDCTPAHTSKAGAVAGQAADQLIHIKIFKHKTVREVSKEWHYDTAEQVSVKGRLRLDSKTRLSLYGKGYARSVSKELQQKIDLSETIECLNGEQGLPEEVALQVVELAKQFDLTQSAPNGNFNTFYLRQQWKHRDEAKASELLTKQNSSATVEAFDGA